MIVTFENTRANRRLDPYIDYGDIMRDAGWKVTHLIDSPLSSERFRPHMVRNMQKNNTLGVVRRSLIVGIKT